MNGWRKGEKDDVGWDVMYVVVYYRVLMRWRRLTRRTNHLLNRNLLLLLTSCDAATSADNTYDDDDTELLTWHSSAE